jgi:hypothetical protein
MRCRDVEREILEGAALPEAAVEHLAGCAACRTLNDAHRAMQALAGTQRHPSLPVPDLASALARRRRTQVKLWAAMGAATAAVALAAWVVTSPRPAQPAEDDSAWQTLPPLLAFVDGMLERELGPTDFAYRPFGELAVWLAPTEDPLDEFTPTLPEEEP